MWELRTDEVLQRWVLYSTVRGKRPHAFAAPPEQMTPSAQCPFCPGNERMTPPAYRIYLPPAENPVVVEGEDAAYQTGWLVRCIPNLYPAVAPPDKASPPVSGFHELIIETPHHEDHPGVMPVRQLSLVFRAILDRLSELKEVEAVRYVSIFRNHHRRAGASLAHPHLQLVATTFLPPRVEQEQVAFTKYLDAEGGCYLCRAIEQAREQERLVFETERFAAFTPRATISPFEVWVAPQFHQARLLDQSSSDREELAKILSHTLKALRALLNDPPYNLVVHHCWREEKPAYHWHIRIIPRVTTYAGFEYGTGVIINPVLPEQAAAALRKLATKT